MSRNDVHDTSKQAIFLPEPQIQAFVAQYKRLMNETAAAEEKSTDLPLIASMNFQMAEQIQGFLTMLRSSTATEGTPNAMLISFDEIRMLETESQLRLIRSEVVQQAQTFDLGNVLVSSLDQNRIREDIEREIQRLNEGGGEGGGGDESQEERNPDQVDLDKSDGLYTIMSTQQATDLDRLVGYEQETKTLLNMTHDVRVIGVNESDRSEQQENNRPLAIILYGPPGTGKTTSAQSIAKALNLTYMYVNAENITSMWAGGTQKNIAKVFRRARIAAQRYNRKTLLLIDEIDGLIKNRKTNVNMTTEEYSRITTILQMMTPPVGIDNSQIVCMFTTNSLSNLDSAFVNRARQTLFFGYIVRPVDRATLLHRFLAPYTNIPRENIWAVLSNTLAEYVPRDLVNLTAAVRALIVSRYQDQQQNQQVSVIDLRSNSQLLLNEIDLWRIVQNNRPATPIAVYFDYEPPRLHVLDWLENNRNNAPDAMVQAFEAKK